MPLTRVPQELLKIPVVLGQVQINHRKAENDDNKIKNAKLGSARAAPRRGTRKIKIGGVERKHQERYDVLGVVIPKLAAETVDPDKAKCSADGDGNEANEDAAAAHAIEKLERRQAPDDVAKMMVAEKSLLGEEYEAQNESKSKGGIGEDTERDVE